MKHVMFTAVTVLAAALVLTGCARAAKNTDNFAQVDSFASNVSLAEAWPAVRDVLREKELEIYTRDKGDVSLASSNRGVFVAFSKKRRHLLVPHRTKITVRLDKETASSTKVRVETINQVYGVTLLTHPNWHDRKTVHTNETLALVDAMKTALVN